MQSFILYTDNMLLSAFSSLQRIHKTINEALVWNITSFHGVSTRYGQEQAPSAVSEREATAPFPSAFATQPSG